MNISRIIPTRTLIVLAILATTVFAAQTAFATTAAFHTIRNTATVDYDDAAGLGNYTASDTADVSVELVASTPVLSSPADGATDPATAEVYNYTLTSTANGPDSYNLTEASLVESAGISGSTSAFSATPIILGGSSVATVGSIAAAGTTTIDVPSDAASGGDVNGIGAGDTVVINGQVFSVASVDDTNGGTPSAISTITVNGNGTVTAIAVGDQIGEQAAFTLTVTPGTVSAATDQTVTVTINAQDSGAVAAAASDATTTTVQVANLTITKVADVATAAPGDTITYTITVSNGGSSNATNVTLTDAVPTFTTYVANSTRLNGITVNGDGATSPLAGGLLIDDDGARTPAAVATGVIAGGSSATITFQVTVDN